MTPDICPLCGIEDSGTSCGAHPCGLIDSDAKLLAEAKALDEAYASVMPAEQYNADLLALVQAARGLVTAMEGATGEFDVECFVLTQALDQFEPWLEGDSDDPRANGWVDDKGRP